MYTHEKYDYYEAVRDNVLEFLEENGIDVTSEEFHRDDLIYDLMNMDSVTGNPSGSYTFSTWEAQLNLVGNKWLMDCAQEELDLSVEDALDPETLDVAIRMYVLTTWLDDLLEELGWEGV